MTRGSFGRNRPPAVVRKPDKIMKGTKMKISILSKQDLEKILEMPKVIEGVETVYKLKSSGKTVVWPYLEHHFPEYNAVTDVKSGVIYGDVNLHGLKMLNTFPMNSEKSLPSFNGLLMVFDSTTGLPLGIMDASYITCMRTGAAGAIGAKALARRDSETLFVLGAGKQSIYQIAATLISFPQLKKVYIAAALDYDNARQFAASLEKRLSDEFNIESGGVQFLAAENMEEALGESDIVITITPARKPVIKKEWIKPGTHLSCVGADMLGKEEIEPEIFKGARVFCDDINQCVNVGESELPVKTGVIKRENIAGEIGQVLSGEKEGRKSAEDITIFDATGIALLDLITAKAAIEAAVEKQLGSQVEI